jgi:hypothetical protein
MNYCFTYLNYSGQLKLSVKLLSLLSILIATCWAYAHAAETAQDFNHDETDFPLDATHALVSCDICHVKGVFQGTPTQCWRCHSLTGRIRASTASPQHISTTRDCEYCHQTGNWAYVIKVDHFAVLGTCQSCHDGVTALGKDPGHIQSSDVCDDCHRTFSWADAGFDHTGVVGNCISCHDDNTAIGKGSTNHMPTTDTCEDCHNTIRFSPVVRVDHTAVIGSCFSCHNGVIAQGKEQKPGHDTAAVANSTSNVCNDCHSSLAWTPATPAP